MRLEWPDDGEIYERYAAEVGKSAEALSHAERGAAYINWVMEQVGEAMMTAPRSVYFSHGGRDIDIVRHADTDEEYVRGDIVADLLAACERAEQALIATHPDSARLRETLANGYAERMLDKLGGKFDNNGRIAALLAIRAAIAKVRGEATDGDS